MPNTHISISHQFIKFHLCLTVILLRFRFEFFWKYRPPALLVKVPSKFFSRFVLYKTEPKAKFDQSHNSYSKKNVEVNFIKFIFRIPQPFFISSNPFLSCLPPSTFLPEGMLSSHESTFSSNKIRAARDALETADCS